MGKRLAVLICLASAFLACSGERAENPSDPPAETASAEAPEREEIHWFEGSVDEAFATAEREGKAIFLYWGAVWCPPCHYLKNKVFKRPEFVEKSRRFVAVYLDGDTERAQIPGEKYQTQGYPTVILFAPDGRELLRMSTGIPVEEYAGVLDRALERLRPIGEVLDEVLTQGPYAASPEDLNLLAFHAWDQDARIELELDERVRTFQRLYEGTPAALELEKSRFLTLWLEATSRAHGAEDSELEITDDGRRRAIEALRGLFADPELRRSNLGFISFGARPMAELLVPEGSALRPGFLADWQAAARALENDEELPVDDRLNALWARIELARLQAPEEASELPAELVEDVRQRVAWAAETATGESELQAVVNTMAGLLTETGLNDEAEELLRAKMASTKAPYYYMSWIAGLRKEAGETGEALEWYRKAYDAAEGRYTRFRWGSLYLRQLMELQPEAVSAVAESSRKVVGELLSFDDAFAGGNALRLGQLETAYEEWRGEDPERGAVVAEIAALVAEACSRYPGEGEDSQRQRCENFLSEA